jgi:hypothetical protein
MKPVYPIDTENKVSITSMDELQNRIVSFTGNDPQAPRQETKNHPVETARRLAHFDLKEATAKLELRKVLGNSDLSPDSRNKIRQSLIDDIDCVRACRKLAVIADDLAGEARKRDKHALKAAAAQGKLADMKAQASALESTLADLRARDMRREALLLMTLPDEYQWTQKVLSDGMWKTHCMDFREEALAQELQDMKDQGIYQGETTKEGAEIRLAEIDAQYAALEERQKHALSEGEIRSMSALESQLAEINAAIALESPRVEAITAAARAKEEKFRVLMDAARISAAGVVEVYQIKTAPLAAGLPGGGMIPAPGLQ